MTAAIAPQQLSDLRRAGRDVELIDVRTPAEYGEAHVDFARNFPLERFDAAAVLEARRHPDEPLYVICRSGSRGRQACELLAAAGCREVVNVDGGTQAWEAAGLPVVRGEKSMSLERQVRIVAGALVFVGAALTLWHPYWAALPAFVGAGLMFAGITDTCGMALLLARMPWNQTTCAAPSASGQPG